MEGVDGSDGLGQGSSHVLIKWEEHRREKRKLKKAKNKDFEVHPIETMKDKLLKVVFDFFHEREQMDMKE